MIMEMVVQRTKKEEDALESEYIKGVRHLCESGIKKVPERYILPVSERPDVKGQGMRTSNLRLQLPVIDLARLRSPDRHQVLKSMKKACEEYGFFQVVNHGIPSDALQKMVDVAQRFFELSFEERVKYISADIRAPVRYGTSFNQLKDGVFCWRDFLKLNCHPLDSMLQHWPSSPMDMREVVASYVKHNKSLFLDLTEAILETLGVDGGILKEFNNGSHLMVVNCFPACPEPDLTFGMPPHSDYGFLTLLLHDNVEGLQVQSQGEWVTVQPVPGSVIVNVGDHLEIFSNGRYKSVIHRVLVNSYTSRISVASLHSLPFEAVVGPAPELVNEDHPRLYKDTDFAAFLDYMSSCETTHKNFLESRKLIPAKSQAQCHSV